VPSSSCGAGFSLRTGFIRSPRPLTLLALPLFLCHAFRLAAQDPFEIHTYEYDPIRLGQYSLEAHLNMNAQGTTGRDGPLLPTEHQVHLTLEPTVGLSENFAIGFMFLNAWAARIFAAVRRLADPAPYVRA
jgi:hypothetical protein